MLVPYVGKKPKWPTAQTRVYNFFILKNVSHKFYLFIGRQKRVALRMLNRIYVRSIIGGDTTL